MTKLTAKKIADRMNDATARNRFTSRGQSPTFKCLTCDRMTRDTGQGVDHLCMECFNIAGLDNQVNDSGKPCPADVLAECERELAKIKRLGGNVDKVKSTNDYIWQAKPAKKAKPAAANITVAMSFKKETPGTYVYENTDDDAPIATLYIRKSAMEDGPIKKIAVTVVGA